MIVKPRENLNIVKTSPKTISPKLKTCHILTNNYEHLRSENWSSKRKDISW